MLRKTLSLIITFDATVQAMAAESCLQALGLPGRLIPVPREITAGCGLAWDLITGEKHDFGGGSELPPYSVQYWKMER